MKFVLRSAARRYILRQYEYYLIEKDAARAADRFIAAVQTTIEQLCTNPEMGAPKTLNNSKLAGLRSWPVKGFPKMRVYFLASNKLVRVVRVLHGMRDINPILEDQ